MGDPAFGGNVPLEAPYAPTMSAEQQLEAIQGQAEYFADALDGLRKQIKNLQAKIKKD